jgi:thiol:disulfide interchange protein DsbD
MLTGSGVKPLDLRLNGHSLRLLVCGWISLVALLSSASASAGEPAIPAPKADEQMLLEPQRAFALSARYIDDKTVELRYKVADGYYMYRQRFKFAAMPTTSFKLGAAKFSPGIQKQDPTFGRVEIYRDSVRILLPITRSDKGLETSGGPGLRLRVVSQGCADAGVCFPPHEQFVALNSTIPGQVLPEGADHLDSPENVGQSRSPAAPRSISETLRTKSNH